MPPTSTRPTVAGGRRVYHLGNAVLSAVVFVITLVLSMVMLDPQRNSHLLSARRRTPPIDFTDSVLAGGFTPVVVSVNKHTVLVVPAAPIHGTRYVSRSLDSFFSVGLGSANGTSSAGYHEEAERHSQGAITLSDVYSAVLLHEGVADATQAPDETAETVETFPLSSRRPSVLHLCSALSCVTPYVAQQWSDRAAAALLLANKTKDGATADRSRARPVANFALVFGEASESLAVMRELGEHRVLTAQIPVAHSDHPQSAMPLVGKLELADLQASCSSLKQCSYRSPVKHAQLETLLKAQAQQLPAEASRKRLFKEWVRRNDSHSGGLAWGAVDVLPFTFVTFGKSNTLHGFPLDLVHVDVGSGDSVAALAYLDALASDTAMTENLKPRNLLVSVFASEWVNAIVETLLLLEVGQRYSAIPLHDSCVGLERHFTPRQRWSLSHMLSWMGKQALEGTYLSPSLERSRAAQIPLCTVLLSRQVNTLDELLQMASKAIDSYPPAASPVERFFYYSLGLSPKDEELLTPLPEAASGAKAFALPSTPDVAREVIGFLVQYIYFLIPIGVGFSLTRNLCRRRGVCG
ncbi:hypothetical protein LdCL_360016500 [Leishmania donovani]|uniref:Uncharacterized protein n=1 Tax=Leishmania donovani TaxID=5661 RepID=A0A3Q8IKB7_LEIDO|nr:hypothetical protein LdCL_360016500 [Leishmania donovani]